MTSVNQDGPLALLADDDPVQCALMTRALLAADYRVLAVDNGRAAVAGVLSQAPAIVFLDVQMPELNGIEACRAIRNRLGDRAPPIVVVTSLDRDEDIADGFAAGAIDYLIKPVNWTVFRHRVNGWLTTHRLDQEAVSIAPRTLMVRRDGLILSDSANRAATTLELTLDALLEPGLAEQLQLCVRKVLKSRAPANCSFGHWSATVQAAGLDRVQIQVRSEQQHAAASNDLVRLAYLEPRTELPNRHLFTKTATEALIDAQLRGRRLTLLCIAPEYLRTASSPRTDVAVRDSLARLVEGLRRFDGLVQHATTEQRANPLACIDGAYLVVLVQDPTSAAVKTSLVANIVAALEAGVPTVALHDKNQAIGQACFPRDGDTIESLLQSAILATLEVTTVALTDAKLADDLRDDLGAELSDALDRDQICLYYQPRVCIRTQQVLGAEALLRWQHPLRGPLVARELLRIAELTGLTARVTGWALRAAVAQAAAWSSLRETRIPVSVNISATQLARPDFAHELIALLAEAGLDPALLEIEVGEVYLDVNDAISAQLLELRAAGVGLIVDDFGHGRIALSALRRLRIDGFKVNHVTLRELQAEGDSGIYDLAASIARVRHAVLIGKGIENAAELALAAAKGCDQAQGFHICQPLPASDFARFARAAIPTAAAG